MPEAKKNVIWMVFSMDTLKDGRPRGSAFLYGGQYSAGELSRERPVGSGMSGGGREMFLSGEKGAGQLWFLRAARSAGTAFLGS